MLIEQYPDAKFYFASIGPVDGAYGEDGIEPDRLNEATAEFNQRMHDNCKATYIDVRAYLSSKGFRTADGIHYEAPTSMDIFTFCMDTVSPKADVKSDDEKTTDDKEAVKSKPVNKEMESELAKQQEENKEAEAQETVTEEPAAEEPAAEEPAAEEPAEDDSEEWYDDEWYDEEW